jgi:hypothetical protein
MKYLVVKGWLGFGDRLETLKMAVKYAQTYNLKIYVDWRDSMWSHGNESFYTYFKLINMPILQSLDEIPADATVYPPYWKDRLNEQITREINDKKGELGIDLGIIDKPFDTDVLVVSSIGNRLLFTDGQFFANCFKVVDQRVLQKIRERKSRFPIEQSWGIHIRGTDRLRPHKRMISVQSIASLVTCYGGLNNVKMTVVSDDKDNLEIWKRYYPESFVASELSVQQNSTAGNHNLDKDKLKFTKDEMNVDLLADFFTLALTQKVYTTCKDSRFTKEAQRLHPYVNSILG